MSHELTPREIDVVRLVAGGMADKEIGRALGITGITVRNHLASVRDKLGFSNRTQVAVYAIQTGLASRPAAGGAQ